MASRRRRRVGVALMLDGRIADEVQGLRRALGDRSISRIDPHVTLVSPLNLRPDDLLEALSILRHAAAAAPPAIEVTIGPIATFAPANPVLYLGVHTPSPALATLRANVVARPLQRPSTWPWVPHVTVADEVDADRIRSSVANLSAYQRNVTFDRVVLLELQEGKWGPLADVVLGPPSWVGTGGFALELTRSRILDPPGRALLDELGAPMAQLDGCAPHQAGHDTAWSKAPVVFTARVDGVVRGVAAGWIDDAGGHVGCYVAVAERRHGVGRHLLAAVESAATAEGWECGRFVAQGPAEFYAAVSARWRYSNATEE